jgi:hypothetical protein
MGELVCVYGCVPAHVCWNVMSKFLFSNKIVEMTSVFHEKFSDLPVAADNVENVCCYFAKR